MLALAIVVLGLVSLQTLKIDLLPKLIYPDVRIRVLDPGVPAAAMEDRVTRQLEEQLAITEDAIGIQSRTSEGRSAVDLSFEYGKDIDTALRDASIRLDRARRFLPEGIDPPIIYKRDPSQSPVLELVISSNQRNPIALRAWADHQFSRHFLNIPGVASTEVGGGLVREIQILPNRQRMAALGITLQSLKQQLQDANLDTPAGRLESTGRNTAARTQGRFTNLQQIADLPIKLVTTSPLSTEFIPLSQIARIIDGHEDEKLRVRVNGIAGVKVSLQKQPQANTVAVVDSIRQRLNWLQQHDNNSGQIPSDIQIHQVADQAIFIRHALSNAAQAAIGGALLAMLVVYAFLGNLRRTLIIGIAIPLGITVTFGLMTLFDLSLNIMTIGGLALGIGMLVDNTIVMLDNLQRHQQEATKQQQTADLPAAAGEVSSAIIASTSTNLAAVLPFLFIVGLTGLLFRELIFTISAAILASLLVAMTLVPAWAARVPASAHRQARIFPHLQNAYAELLSITLKHPLWVLLVFSLALIWGLTDLQQRRSQFLPKVDEGQIFIGIQSDPGTALNQTDRHMQRIEQLLLADNDVQTVFTTAGGFIFGRSEYQSSHRGSIQVQLKPPQQRQRSTANWLRHTRKAIKNLDLIGIKVRLRSRGVRGIRLSRGDDDLSIRLQGPELTQLQTLANLAITHLQTIPALQNLQHSLQEHHQEIVIQPNRERATALGISTSEIGQAVQNALQGSLLGDFIDADHSINIRLKPENNQTSAPSSTADLAALPLPVTGKSSLDNIQLGDVADIEIRASAATIQRDHQQRIVEISASLSDDADPQQTQQAIEDAFNKLELPPGYSRYDGGSYRRLTQQQSLFKQLLALAIFLVLVVMTVQYESLRNPLLIAFSVVFSLTGVALGLTFTGLPLSMPVYLGMIMLAGIVVNNAIVLVEFIELKRQTGEELTQTIIEAARLRLRPILMTTLTTVVGMAPLALGWGEGAEMLQPLAVTLVAGLSFSVLVSLLLVPGLFRVMHRNNYSAE